MSAFGSTPKEYSLESDGRAQKGGYLDEGRNETGVLENDLLCFDKVGYMTQHVHATSVVTPSVAVDAATRDEKQRK